jgi:glucosyl-dolichyl phosphate glucuronosyltransferase
MDNFISVIVCTYNRERYIGTCLEHLHRQSAPKDQYEVIVVNNNSTDNTEKICMEVINQYPETNFRYFIERQQGLSHSRNRGIREAHGNIIAFLDDDAFPREDYIANLNNSFRDHKDVMAVGGKIIPQYEEAEPNWMSPYLLPLVAAQDLGNKTRPFNKRKFPIGANMAFRKQAFDQYGLFNTNLGRKGTGLEGGEEKDFFLRMQAGKEIILYIPDVLVKHIIPPKRVQLNYIRGLGRGVGSSERTRIQETGGMAPVIKIMDELLKSVGSILLFFGYLLTGKPAAGWMLVKFRMWVIKGLLFGQ